MKKPALKNVTLEMSLKPFTSTDPEKIEKVCRIVFEQWLPLVRYSDMVSVLLWTADGSEILDYRGDMDTELEWARYIGGANRRAKVKSGLDPDGLGLHSRNHLYIDNPPIITYGDLRMIVKTLRRVGEEATGLPVRVGETFDPGPEFAKSPFKYERHPEVCLGIRHGYKSFVCCYGVLEGDDTPYAGFPDGIPDSTPFGRFFGRQCRHFLTDLDFDYLWLSNGFGFGRENWSTTGELFDGEAFDEKRYGEIRDKVLLFWSLFREECPDIPVETRGTNLTAGIDLASDGVPTRDIYAGGYGMLPPPNSPWAALNGDFGLELIGYMSRNSVVPEDDYPFRFYVHDPWWLNSPWLDRYGREPHDIYLPLSVARIDEKGIVRNPTHVQFLTIDNSYGGMPEQCQREVVPHILAGLADAPDAPAPVVWVYPFDEYHDWMENGAGKIDEILYGDWFMRDAVNNGLPLSMVIATRNLVSAIKEKPNLLTESVLVSVVPDAGSEIEDILLSWIEEGGRAIFYGPTKRAGPKFLEMANLAEDTPISGILDISLPSGLEGLDSAPFPGRINHRELFCAGGITEVVANDQDSVTNALVTVSKEGQQRVALVQRSDPDWKGGGLCWVRGTNSDTYTKGNYLLTPDNPEEFFPGGLLPRIGLANFGYRFATMRKSPNSRLPVTTVGRHQNGFFFSGYLPDTSVGLRLMLPQGAPLFLEYEAEMADGHALYHMPRAWHRECRIFVEQSESSILSCREIRSSNVQFKRRMAVSGLVDATVRFYPETSYENETAVRLNSQYPWMVGDDVDWEVKNDRLGLYIEAKNATGELLFSW